MTKLRNRFYSADIFSEISAPFRNFFTSSSILELFQFLLFHNTHALLNTAKLLLPLQHGHAGDAAAAAAGWLRCLHAIVLLPFFSFISVALHFGGNPSHSTRFSNSPRGSRLSASLAPVARERRIKIDLFFLSLDKSARLLENVVQRR